MVAIVERTPRGAVHPFPAAMLAGSLSLFLCTLLADYAYWSTYQIEWTNFASWLLIGGMVFATIALLFALVDLFRNRRGLLYTLLLAATWILGFLNALHHARDAWAVMPVALVLSVAIAVLACVSTWVGFSSLRAGGAK